jgi:hypothetical protein
MPFLYMHHQGMISDDERTETVQINTRLFFFSIVFRPALESTQSPFQWILGVLSLGVKWHGHESVLSLGVKWHGHEAEHSPLTSVEVKNPLIRFHGIELN